MSFLLLGFLSYSYCLGEVGGWVGEKRSTQKEEPSLDADIELGGWVVLLPPTHVQSFIGIRGWVGGTEKGGPGRGGSRGGP